MQVVTDVEARANNAVNKALSSVLESEVKTQRIVKSAAHSSNQIIAKISRRANKTIFFSEWNNLLIPCQTGSPM